MRFLLLLLLLGGSTLFAQEQMFLAGGSLGFSQKSAYIDNFFSSSYSRRTLLTTSPFFGYYITQRHLLGAAIDFRYEKDILGKNLYGQKPYSISRSILATPFYRAYFSVPAFIQLQVSIGIQYTESDFFNDYQTSKTNTEAFMFGYGVGLGYSFYMSESVAVEPVIKYSLFRQNSKTDYLSDIFLAELVFNLGLVYRF